MCVGNMLSYSTQDAIFHKISIHSMRIPVFCPAKFYSYPQRSRHSGSAIHRPPGMWQTPCSLPGLVDIVHRACGGPRAASREWWPSLSGRGTYQCALVGCSLPHRTSFPQEHCPSPLYHAFTLQLCDGPIWSKGFN